MSRPEPFYLDVALEPAKPGAKYARHNNRIPDMFDQSKRPIIPIHYRHSNTHAILRLDLPASQVWHLADWLAATSVCRRWRRMGKQAFFGRKMFAMGSSMPEKLAKGVERAWSSEDQSMLLQRAREVVYVLPYAGGLGEAVPSELFARMEGWVGRLRRVERVVLLFGFCGVVERLVEEVVEKRRRVPRELRGFFGLGGPMRDGLRLEASCCSGVEWVMHLKYLESVYPRLRARRE
ncbi:MAG: hypothetical protein MMC23_002756 [Stictis urceolatum]|nr:hypothetical protein [Stictis urceolata]